MSLARISLVSNNGTKLQASQLRRRNITKRGFQLTIMVCGRAGLGKSTFVNSLCDLNVIDRNPEEEEEIDDKQGTQNPRLISRDVKLDELDGTCIKLTVIDPPGFGGKIDNSESCETILRYLETQFEEVLHEEARVHRHPHFEDTLVHVCLYFLPPTRHIRELDIEHMKTLSLRVNILPVIAKSDTLTASELKSVKSAVRKEIKAHNIPIFSFTCDENEEDIQVKKEAEELSSMVPFAVAGSNTVYEIDGEHVRARDYPWGMFEIDNPFRCDFVILRSVLLGSHLQEFRDSTLSGIYENYRTERLRKEPNLFGRLLEEEEKLEQTKLSSVPPLSTIAVPSHH